MTSPLEIPGYGRVSNQQIAKEDLMDLWKQIIHKTEVRPHIRTGEQFEGAEKGSEDVFVVRTSSSQLRTKRIILAIGRRGTPRKLDIPGEMSSNVAYSLLEPEHFQSNRITVVGGGDSAIEAALSLAEQPETTVRLSYRKATFSRLKPTNLERINQAIGDRVVDFLPESELVTIESDRVVIRNAAGSERQVENDYVFIFAGGVLPTRMLADLDIEIDTKFGEPLMSN